MNAKETELNRIIDTVVECCATTMNSRVTLTRDDVLGRCRTENAVMTRCLLVEQILGAGFSIGTVAFVLDRSPQSVRLLRKHAEDFHATNRSYRIAEEDIIQRCAQSD